MRGQEAIDWLVERKVLERIGEDEYVICTNELHRANKTKIPEEVEYLFNKYRDSFPYRNNGRTTNARFKDDVKYYYRNVYKPLKERYPDEEEFKRELELVNVGMKKWHEEDTYAHGLQTSLKDKSWTSPYEKLKNNTYERKITGTDIYDI